MEAIIIIGCATYVCWQGVKTDYNDYEDSDFTQENEQKQHHNDTFWPL
tara:strand:+ start:249 stop:392 length:144 start_codon:yes stop_codon:yes gene_type:complete